MTHQKFKLAYMCKRPPNQEINNDYQYAHYK